MKIAAVAFASLLLASVTANADECRRVTTPTVLAVVAHGGVWTRIVDQGKTFAVRQCGIRMYGNVYCLLNTDGNPPVYLQQIDQSGREYTAFWGRVCR
ncbi:MAG: hypothetical protein WBP94_19995 [Rhodomicrobiaceae bacterium]